MQLDLEFLNFLPHTDDNKGGKTNASESQDLKTVWRTGQVMDMLPVSD